MLFTSAVWGCSEDDNKKDMTLNVTEPLWGSCIEQTGLRNFTETIHLTSVGNNTLRIRHENAVYNCCMERVEMDVYLDKDTLIIKEIPFGDNCNCICPYEIKYDINNLNYGKYYVSFSKRDAPPTIYAVDFNKDTEESFNLIE